MKTLYVLLSVAFPQASDEARYLAALVYQSAVCEVELDGDEVVRRMREVMEVEGESADVVALEGQQMSLYLLNRGTPCPIAR